MRRLVLLLAGLLCGAYPLLLWWGVTHDQLLPVLSVMGLGCALRLLLTSGSGGAGGSRLLAGIGLLLCLLVGCSPPQKLIMKCAKNEKHRTLVIYQSR